MINKKNTAIVIASAGNFNYLHKCLKAIFKQTSVPNQIILVLPKEKKFKKDYKKLKVLYSDKKNQVHQRNLGISKLSKFTRILIQLDERVILRKNSIEKLIECWNMNVGKNVLGIGFNQLVNKNQNSFNGSTISKILINKKGSVLKTGMNIGYENLKKDLKVSWIKGGLASYDITKSKKIFNRSFPLLSWSVCEDLIFSYDLQKKGNLLICAKAKAILLKKKIDKRIINNFIFGTLYSHNFKFFVKKNKELSTIFFYLMIKLLFLYNLIQGIFKLNISKIFYSFGLIFGLFKKNLFKN